MSNLPRGIRNANPGNIERTKPRTPWQGRLPEDQLTDSRFEQFTDPVYGIRALARTLITYQDQHKLRTVRQIINRWAPPKENNTTAYVRVVAQHLGVEPDTAIDVQDYEVMRPVVEAIIDHENGSPRNFGRTGWYTRAQLDTGLRLAGIVAKPATALRRDPEAVGTATGATGALGATLLEASQQMQVVGAGSGFETLKTVLMVVMIAGIVLTAVSRLRRARRETSTAAEPLDAGSLDV